MNELFRFWVPMSVDVQKSLSPQDPSFDPRRHMRVFGCVSTDRVDHQDEKVLQDGLDFSDCRWFNDDHQRNTAVGVPERTMFLRKGRRDPYGEVVPKTGWYVDGYMLPTPRGIELYQTAAALQKLDGLARRTDGAPHRLGFSIQGKALRSPGVVHKVKVHEIAITTLPVNDDTFCTVSSLVKSLSAGHDVNPTSQDADPQSALLPESLEREAPMIEVGKGCRTAADFARDRRERGMSETEYKEAIAKSGRADVYATAEENDELRKSLRSLEARVHGVASAVDAVDARLEDVAKSMSDDKDDGGDDGGDEEEEGETDNDDGAEEADEDEDDMSKSVNAMVERLEAQITHLAKSQAALGNLVEALADNFEEERTANGELRKSINAAGAAPLAARGATSAGAAAAMAAAGRRGFGNEQAADAGDKGATRDELRKSLRAAVSEAIANNDSDRMSVLGDIATQLDINQLANAQSAMKRLGVIA